MEKNHFMYMHCWLKLNVHSKWIDMIVYPVKISMVTEDEGGDPTVQHKKGFAPTNKVIRDLGRKWEEEKEKREGAMAKMMEEFDDIMAKKEEAKRFCIFVEMQDKNLNLQEKKFEIKAASEDFKMLRENVRLDPNVGKIVCPSLFARILKRFTERERAGLGEEWGFLAWTARLGLEEGALWHRQPD